MQNSVAVLLLLILTLFLANSNSEGSTLHKESWYASRDCTAINGVTGALAGNDDGTYSDCVALSVVIEYDFAKKWYECIAQAGHYGLQTGLIPICKLIVENEERDLKYVHRAKAWVKAYADRKIFIEIIDFSE